ncbi:hypothetical protein FQN57_000795 [Myotisia sp. PD_48]|nr:hypothetical protein FQN57_000795 [Myotisia sp. PD_48]
MTKQTIVVIGAGVIGLSSALTLIKRLSSSKYEILIVASHLPTDPPHPSYASINAGAHFRPIPGTTPQLKYEAQLAKITFNRFDRLVKENPHIGVRFMEGIDYVSGPATPDYKAMIPDYVNSAGFRLLEYHELPSRVEFGARYDSFTVDPDTYTFHLLRRFQLKGGKLLRMKLESMEEAFRIPKRNVSLIVNCSGMGFGDPKSFIIRGQTCLIAKTLDKTVTQQNQDGTWTFFVPRPLNGGTIIGGTKEPNDWNPTPSRTARDQLLYKAGEMYPEILNSANGFDVVKDVVGRRPAREGGLRLEAETLPDGRKAVHAYGLGGRGYELSWGVAEEVYRLVTEAICLPIHSQL